MTALEMYNEAQLVYESIASNDAPGYDEYEWSTLLTKASENVLRSILNEGLDSDDFNRKAVHKLLRTYVATTSNGSISDYDEGGTTFDALDAKVVESISANCITLATAYTLTITLDTPRIGATVVAVNGATITDGVTVNGSGHIVIVENTLETTDGKIWSITLSTGEEFLFNIGSGNRVYATNNAGTLGGSTPTNWGWTTITNLFGNFNIDNIYLILEESAGDDAGNLEEIVPISYSTYRANKKNPYKKPIVGKKAWRLMYNNKMIIISESDISKYRMIYVKRPDPIIVPGAGSTGSIRGTNLTSLLNTNGQDSELHPLVHDKVVNEAAKLAKLYVSDVQGWQAHLTEIKN